MAHELAGALEQAGRIGQRCAVKETHVYVQMEHIDVAEGRISQTGNRAAVMQKLPDFVPAFSHHLKPVMRDGSQFTCMLFHPSIDGGIPLDRAVESQQFLSHRRDFGISGGGVLSWRFERYLLVPGCHTFLILHGIAETLGLDAELAKSVQGHQSAMRVECHDMGEDAAEREGLSRFAQSVDERIIPGAAVPDVTENMMQFGIGLFEPLQHRLRGALRFGRAVRIQIGSGQRGGPDLFREDNVF
jgi:hypothetical protein